MLPVIFQFNFDTLLSQILLYVFALGLVAYAAWAGWRGAASQKDQLLRAVVFGVVGAVIAGVGLHYALPKTAFLGGKGEGIPIHTYGVMIATGFILAVAVAGQLCLREWRGEEGLIKRDQMMDLAFWELLAGLAGARVLFIITKWSEYSKDPMSMFAIGGGLVFYGGLIGAIIAAIFFTRKNKIDFFRLGDLAIPTVSLGQCFGRLGCFSAGCCWGDVAHQGFLFGAKFPGAGIARNLFGGLANVSSLAAADQATDSRFVIPTTGQILHHPAEGAVRISEWVAQHGHTLPVHPTQIYESIGQLILFVSFLYLRRYRRFHGQILGMWLMAYAVLRTTVELFRGDAIRGSMKYVFEAIGMNGLAAKIPLEAWWNISTSQFISLCMFTIGATILYRRSRGLASRGNGGLTPAPAAG